MLDQNQGYEDDSEVGQGRNILRAMRDKNMTEMSVYVVCHYGGTHIGRRRYDIAKDLTFSVIQSYKTITQIKLNRMKAVQRTDSQLSLLTEASAASFTSFDSEAVEGASDLAAEPSVPLQGSQDPAEGSVTNKAAASTEGRKEDPKEVKV